MTAEAENQSNLDFLDEDTQWEPLGNVAVQGKVGAIIKGAVKTISVVFKIASIVHKAILVYKAGRWLMQDPPPGGKRPPVVYDEDSGLLFRLQDDGSYQPNAVRMT